MLPEAAIRGVTQQGLVDVGASALALGGHGPLHGDGINIAESDTDHSLVPLLGSGRAGARKVARPMCSIVGR
ncbi:hypothetical protein GCM10010464_86750 [Pseudonocardia yunnanensis]